MSMQVFSFLILKLPTYNDSSQSNLLVIPKPPITQHA